MSDFDFDKLKREMADLNLNAHKMLKDSVVIHSLAAPPPPSLPAFPFPVKICIRFNDSVSICANAALERLDS